jgi:rRNA maturation protein Nop10
MKWVSGLVGMALVLQGATVGAISVAAAQELPVAIVCVLSGKAVARFDGQRTEIKLFQRLRSGTSVETDAGSSLMLAFFTGDRYELGEKTSVVVRRTDVDRKKGAIQQLAPVPAMIDIAPIAREENPGGRFAGTRIRAGGGSGKSITNLYPSGGAATVADAAFVRFDGVDGYQRYRVEVEDETGSTVLAVLQRRFRFLPASFGQAPVTTGACGRWTLKNPHCGGRRCSLR